LILFWCEARTLIAEIALRMLQEFKITFVWLSWWGRWDLNVDLNGDASPRPLIFYAATFSFFTEIWRRESLESRRPRQSFADAGI